METTESGVASPLPKPASGNWVFAWTTKSLHAVTSSPLWAFLVVMVAIGCVAYADSKADVSLAYLYILPLSFSAILLSRRVTLAMVALCIFFHDLFGPPIHHLQGRILHNLSAFIGFLFVVIVLQWFVAQRNSLNELTRRQRDELLNEVELAAEVQRMFLPEGDSDTGGFEIAGMMHPARLVGGDYYNHTVKLDGNLRLVIADVSGKGVAAALLMAATAAAMRIETNEPHRLCEVTKHLNEELFASQDDGRFVTVLLGELDPRSRRLQYINCGHNPALLLRGKSSDVEWLQSSTMPVGLSPDLDPALVEITLEPADVLVWYTDGVSEASNVEGQEFGTGRILKVVRENSNGTAREICNAINRAVADFTKRDSLDDDLTVMVVKLKEDADTPSFPALSD